MKLFIVYLKRDSDWIVQKSLVNIFHNLDTEGNWKQSGVDKVHDNMRLAEFVDLMLVQCGESLWAAGESEKGE